MIENFDYSLFATKKLLSANKNKNLISKRKVMSIISQMKQMVHGGRMVMMHVYGLHQSVFCNRVWTWLQ